MPAHSLVWLPEALVGLTEALVWLPEALVGLTETLVWLPEALVGLTETLVLVSKTLQVRLTEALILLKSGCLRRCTALTEATAKTPEIISSHLRYLLYLLGFLLENPANTFLALFIATLALEGRCACT